MTGAPRAAPSTGRGSHVAGAPRRECDRGSRSAAIEDRPSIINELFHLLLFIHGRLPLSGSVPTTVLALAWSLAGLTWPVKAPRLPGPRFTGARLNLAPSGSSLAVTACFWRSAIDLCSPPVGPSSTTTVRRLGDGTSRIAHREYGFSLYACIRRFPKSRHVGDNPPLRARGTKRDEQPAQPNPPRPDSAEGGWAGSPTRRDYGLITQSAGGLQGSSMASAPGAFGRTWPPEPSDRPCG